MSDVHEVLVKARNIIDRDGWVQHNFGEEGGPRCTSGAVSGALGHLAPEGFSAALRAVEVAATIPDPERFPLNVVSWNNASERTKAEVLAAFDRAIADTAPAPPDPFESDIPLPDSRAQPPGPKADNRKRVPHSV